MNEEEKALAHIRERSERLTDTLRDFQFICPLCRGEARLVGLREQRLYEMRMDLPGEVEPLSPLRVVFQCFRCGFVFEFDEDFFEPERVGELGAGLTRVSRREYRVLVSLGHRSSLETLLTLARVLAKAKGGEVLALHVVPKFLYKDSLLEEAAAYDSEEVPVRSITRLGRDIGRTIIEAAAERGVNLLVLGWRGYTRSRGVLLGRVLDRVIEETPCDVAVVRDRGLSQVERILVPTAGGPNAALATEMAIALAEEYGGKVTALYICRSGTEAEVEQAKRVIDQTLAGFESDRPLEPRVIVTPDVVQGVLAEAKEHDLVLLGATREGLFQQLVVGNVPETIARRCSKTVIIVKRHAGPVRSWLHRLWGGERGAHS